MVLRLSLDPPMGMVTLESVGICGCERSRTWGSAGPCLSGLSTVFLWVAQRGCWVVRPRGLMAGR